MKTNILTIEGKKGKEINLPKCFSVKIREEIIAKVIEAQKKKQPYAPSSLAGKQYSARGKIIHRRHVWKSGYGRGASRVPRKAFSRRGSQFNWEAAGVPHTRGGPRAHPPKIDSMMNVKKINKKELQIALASAISATADEKQIIKRYETLKGKKINIVPLIVESKFISLKVKDLVSSLNKILGKDLFKIAIRKKSVRAGKGKMRGRKYKYNAGLLLVTGKKEKVKTKTFETANIGELNVTNLAKGGTGRLTIYTEQAIKELEDKFKNFKETKKSEKKKWI